MKTRKIQALWLVLILILAEFTPFSFAASTWWPIGKSEKTATTTNNVLPTNGNGVVVTFAPVVKKVAPSVVNILTTKQVRMIDPFLFFGRFFGPEMDERLFPRTPPRYRRQNSLGSGVIVSQDGYILTNYHVVEGAEEIKVVVPTNKSELVARVVGKDAGTDVALLKIDAPDLIPMELGDSDKLEVGDLVLAIGNPFGVGQTVTMGIISGLGRKNLRIEDYEDFIQTDASINPGNSGGALVDTSGRLIGINTAIVTGTGGNQGVGFAIPVNLARYVMQQIREKGRVIRGYLGVAIQDLTPDLAKEFNLPENTNGVLISSIEPGSAAANADLRKGDVILAFNDKSITDAGVLRLLVSQTAPGTVVHLKINRDGKERNVRVILQELIERREVIPTGGSSVPEQSIFEGLEISDITDELKQFYSLPEKLSGVIITSVDPGSVAAEAGLQEGDVIQAINKETVINAADAIAKSKKAKGDRILLLIWHKGTTSYVVLKNVRSPSR